MKTQLDFIKIKNGEWGAINFNNMIPIGKASRTPVEIDLLPNDTHAEKAYKELLSNQLSWCNQTVNGTAILSKAEKLYHIIVSGKGHEALRQRCCDFQLLEEKCSEWERLHPSIELQNTVPTKTQIKSEMSFIERLEQAKQEANRRNEAKQQSRNFTHTIEK
jgi:protein AbiQ